MALIRATVKLNMRSGVEKDAAINVWHFENTSVSITQPDAVDFRVAFAAFYSAFATYLGHSMSRVANAHEITFAEVDRGAPGVADDVVSRVLWTELFTLTGTSSGTTSLPSECALALSFRGDITGFPEESGSTRPAARKRGRSFLGPWNTSAALTDASTGVVSFDPAKADIVLDAYTDFIAAINAFDPTPHNHVVYSPRNGSSAKVTQAHIDMAFDTMRSRGIDSTSRDTRAITQSVLV